MQCDGAGGAMVSASAPWRVQQTRPAMTTQSTTHAAAASRACDELNQLIIR
jgi:hypothetical protein